MIRSKIPYPKFTLVSLVIFVWLCQSCDTEGNLDPDYKNHFVRFIGDEGNQEGVDLIIDESDQSLMLLGTTTVPGTAQKRIFLVKADWEGNVIWKKKLGGPYDVAKDIERSNDGGYVILSESSGDVQISNGLGVKLIAVTTEGVKTDSAVFKSSIGPSDFPSTVTPISDGYIVTGSTQHGTQWAIPDADNVSDVLRIKFSTQLDFDPLYDGFQSKAENDYGYKTVQLGDLYYTFGSANYSPSGNANTNYNFWCFASSADGFPGEEFIVGNDVVGDEEILYAVCPSLNSGYFLAGTLSQGLNTKDIYIGFAYNDNGFLRRVNEGTAIKIPLSADRKITTTAVCPSIANPRGYLILGTEGDEGFRNIWLSKVSDVGDKLYWSSIFGASDRNDDRAAAVAELPDGRILVVGTVNLGVNNLKMSLFKLNSEGKFAN